MGIMPYISVDFIGTAHVPAINYATHYDPLEMTLHQALVIKS